MEDAAFWDLIAEARRKVNGDMRRMADVQSLVLSNLSPEQLVEFERAFNRQIARSSIWDLWAAAYLMQGGCSDDGFFYFRGWLVAQGQAIYTAAVTMPDSLADLADPDDEDAEETRDVMGEEFLYVARQTYAKQTGHEMPVGEVGSPVAGSSWDFEDEAEMTRRLPRLSRLYNR